MEKSKIITGVLAVGLAASLVGNLYLWNTLNQQAAGYTTAMAQLEEELAQAKGERDALTQELEQVKTDLENTKQELEQAKSDLEAAKAEEAKKAEEARKAEEAKKAEEEAKKKEESNQNNQNPGNAGTGGTTTQGGGNPSGIDPEIQKILDELGFGSPNGGTGTGGGISDHYTGPGINWNK